MTSSQGGGSAGAPAAPPTCYRHADRETWIRCQRCERPICPDCMRSAAVGFQCPDCVREGARSTRQGRTPYGGNRVGDPRASTLGLLALNVAVWLLVVATGATNGGVFRALALVPARTVYLTTQGQTALVDGVAAGSWWQVLTANVTHYSPLHLLMNLLFLFWIGPIVEGPIGRARFLAAALVTGLTSSAAVMWLSGATTTTMGFSGVAMGLFGLFVVMAVKVGGNRDVLVQMIGFQLIFNLIARDVISWQGHLGGFVGGLLVGAVIVYAPRERRALLQWSGIALVGVLALAAIGVRALQLAGPALVAG